MARYRKTGDACHFLMFAVIGFFFMAGTMQSLREPSAIAILASLVGGFIVALYVDADIMAARYQDARIAHLEGQVNLGR